MQRTLGYRLFRSFATVIAVVGILIGLVGTYLINRAAVDEAQRHVRLNLQSAWSIYKTDYLSDLRCFAENLAHDHRVMAIAARREPTKPYAWWDIICGDVRPDILTVTDAEGRVVFRGHAPENQGDLLTDDPMVQQARIGKRSAGSVVWSLERLAREDSLLAKRARIQPVDTPQSRPVADNGATTALMMLVTVPIVGDIGEIVGTIQVGLLLNRHNKLVDVIKDVVFQEGFYGDKPFGTVTIFLGDVRIATNVRNAEGSRAIGTRVSEEVYDRVIGRGQSWVNRAFVVDDWYLAAYEPIYDISQSVVGILYVGLLEKPYRDMRTRTVALLLGVTAIGLILSVAISWLLARRLARPLHRLADATKVLSAGDLAHRVEPHEDDDEEAAQLTTAFNRMADALAARQADLQDANRTLVSTNEQLAQLNHDYLDMLGFVSHELKNPLSSSLLNAYSLRDGILGELSEHQMRAASSMVRNLEYLDEMVRHYLDLTRIEQGRLQVSYETVDVVHDVIEPTIETFSRDIHDHSVTIEWDWPDEAVTLTADPSLMNIVYGNLIGNAIKYGREAGTIRLRAKDCGEHWEFGVWNDGVGITEDKMPELFQKFSRIRQEGQPKRKGTGLGLFVTREIIEKHGGTIHADSEAGHWIEFVFTLPKRENGDNS